MLALQPSSAPHRMAAVVSAQRHYARHRPEQTLLYQIVEQYVEAFFAHLGAHEATLPGFVRDEFEAYLRCGRREHGFLRVMCSQCRHEHLVAFSCKCRGFCPPCGTRRMVETAAHLVDHVFPTVPVRQWVLSFPWPLRLLFAARPEVLTRVLSVIARAVSSAAIKRAGASRNADQTSAFDPADPVPEPEYEFDQSVFW